MTDSVAEVNDVYNEFNLGEQLKHARQEKQLTIEDVARELRLSTKKIIALENNDFSNIPGATYVRGYLRLYANLVGVPTDQIMQAFGKAHVVKKKSAPIKLKKRTPLSVDKINQKWVRILTYAFLGFVFISMMLWWWGNKDSKTSSAVVAASSLGSEDQFKQKLAQTTRASSHKAPMAASQYRETLSASDADEYEY